MKKNTLLSITLIFCIHVCAIQAQTHKQRSGSKRVSIRKAPKYPPYLEASVTFYEPSGNKFLDAEESGRITVTVINSGKGKSEGVALSISAGGDNGLIYSKAHEVGDLKPRQERKISIPITALFTIASRAVSMTFNFSEKNGFEPDPARLTFETREFVKPVLVLVDGLDIDDSNNNGMVESGELVTITAAVQNIGQGTAKGVSVKLTKGENVFFGGESKTEFDLGSLRPGALKKFTFEVYTNKKADAIPIFAAIDESKGKFGKKRKQLPLEFKKRVSKISEVQVVGIESEAGKISVAAGFRIDVEMNIPKTGMKNNDAIAVIFGVENYKNVSTVTFAKRDATYIKEYFEKVLGIPGNRIYFKTDDDVGKAEFDKVFSKDGWLDKRVKEGKTDLYIYYAGHGAPDIKKNKAYLIPYDGDPNYASQTGYEMDELYEQLGSLGARSTTVFLDACFTGANRESEILLAGARPVFMEVDVSATRDVTVFSAAGGKEISSAWPEKKHGLFSYYLMKGMRGDADVNGDKKITVGELGNYVKENVSDMAGMLDREQTPGLQTLDEQKVLIEY